MRRLFSIALAAALCGCAAPQSGEKGGLRPAALDQKKLDAAFEPRRFALVVGIGDYADEQWRDLRFAKKDAQDVAAALGDQTRGDFDDVVVLASPEKTTREQILSALDSLAKKANRPDDVVVVYFSAHGTLARDEKGLLKRYLVTHDASFRDVSGSALGIDALEGKLEKIPSRRRLMVLATCHSGAGKSLLPEALAKEVDGIKSGFFARPLEDVSRAAIVLAASDWGETAREDESLQNDIYTHYLLQGLDGSADRNGDGAVSAYEAHDHARRRTFAFTQGRQRPSAQIMEVGADPIFLAGHLQRTGNPELYSYNPRFDGFTLKVDGEERVELPGGAAVRPGARKVELTKGSELLFARELELQPGERLDLDLLLRRMSRNRTVFLTGGVVGFLDQKTRSEVLPAAPIAGLSLRYDDVLLPDWALWLDIGGAMGQQTLHLEPGGDIPFRYRNFSAGVGLPYQWRLQRFRLFAGPRVAGLLIQRSFSLEAFAAEQSFLTISPGVMAGAAYSATEWLELSVQGNAMLTYVVVDGAGQAMGFSGAWAGVGYRF